MDNLDRTDILQGCGMQGEGNCDKKHNFLNLMPGTKNSKELQDMKAPYKYKGLLYYFFGFIKVI